MPKLFKLIISLSLPKLKYKSTSPPHIQITSRGHLYSLILSMVNERFQLEQKCSYSLNLDVY